MLQRHGCDFPFSNLLNDDGDDFLEKMVKISMQANDKQELYTEISDKPAIY
jgi:hypothetical protein